ncbi:MAG: 6-phosphofructokinase, partial [Acidimicrobiia bacterium]|nr:6-phosphofructokinase [Acidimicrobiia bacterium]
MSTIAVLTSGGDAPGMNAAIHAVTKVAAARGCDVIGVRRGYDGLIDGDMTPLTRRVDDAPTPLPIPEMEGIAQLGGTVLGSARCPRFLDPVHRAAAARNLQEWDAAGLVVVGGNGSITGAHALATECDTPVVAIPASID